MTTHTVNFTSELAQLLSFAGDTAGAIRMYSKYNPRACYGEFTGGYRDPGQAGFDLMFLSDALTQLLLVGKAVEGGDNLRLAEVCDNVSRLFLGYLAAPAARGHYDARPTFAFWSYLVDLRRTAHVLSSLRTKALAACQK